MKYSCELCGRIYDEALGDPSRGIPEGTAFCDLPFDYSCPVCGCEKEAFCKQEGAVQRPVPMEGDQAFWNDVKYGTGRELSDR